MGESPRRSCGVGVGVNVHGLDKSSAFLKATAAANRSGARAAAFIVAMVTQAEAASLVGATNGHTYFNRSGADLASHDAELASCMALAAQMTATDLVGAGMIFEMAKAGTTGANIENRIADQRAVASA